MLKNIIFIFCIIGFQNVLAQGQLTEENDLSPVEDLPTELAETRGAKIYLKDQYAWKASDILFSDPNRDLNKLRGWITKDTHKTASTYFIGIEDDGTYFIKYQVDFDEYMNGTLVEPIEITEDISNMFEARMTSLMSMKNMCSQTYNSVVLEENGKIIIYWLAGTKVHGEIPIGGHYRFTFNKGEKDFIRKERLSNSCLTISPEKNEEEMEAEPVMTMFSHVVSKKPQDVHIFLNLLYGDMSVLADEKIYVLQNGRVTHEMTMNVEN
ncbi:hypothetical protein [Pseudemcibacter aquimaris]|uniref:hypothetical protein n=1 Tax=Pseudemcibacter aquimaris TaxID=2857064 RepID=UPI0020124CAE|nr:hypothetical protein [Pseudemcibacter aquimaris]MCC3860963.1 hypothetical protein [Pseudemcibacter aquimaris]WDU59781.1 hypothetical protein KW060_05870 [Pseudemcibacter aquimaris]